MNQIILNYKNKIFSILSILDRGDNRTVVAKKNIFASFFIKGFGILLTFIQVPLLINYLDPVKYGIWLTISSMVQWFWFFDIGLGLGLRNKFAEALAVDNKLLAKSLVSTTYFILIIITISLLLLLTPTIFILDWTQLLNAPDSMGSELEWIVFVVFIFFILRLIFQPITSMLLGAQKTAISDLIHPLSNLLLIILILLASLLFENSFLLASLILSISPIIIYLIYSMVFFKKDFKDFRPNISSINLSYTKSLFNLGILFFIVQISGVILYSTTNFIIIQLLGPEEVTEYNIAYKYFSSILFLYSLIVNPFWSSFTEAYTLKDYDWIKRTVRKLKNLTYGLFVLLGIMLLFSSFFYELWIGEKVKVSFSLSLTVAIFFGITIFNMVYCYYLNGIGRVKEQAIMSIIGAIIHIPISILLVKYFGLGAEGIILSLIILSIPGIFIWPYLYRKEISSYQ